MLDSKRRSNVTLHVTQQLQFVAFLELFTLDFLTLFNLFLFLFNIKLFFILERVPNKTEESLSVGGVLDYRL